MSRGRTMDGVKSVVRRCVRQTSAPDGRVSSSHKGASAQKCRHGGGRPDAPSDDRNASLDGESKTRRNLQMRKEGPRMKLSKRGVLAWGAKTSKKLHVQTSSTSQEWT